MEEIYEALVRACPVFTLPAPWQEIPCDSAFIALPSDKAALLAELQQQFTADDLIQAGVATRDAEQIVHWHPLLVVEGAPIWAIRTRPDAKPKALIAQLETVGSKIWPAYSALQDHRQGPLAVSADHHVVVAYAMSDLAILRSLGFAVIPGGDWERLNKVALRFLCRQVQGKSSVARSNPLKGELEPITAEPLSLILANWSLATVDCTDIAAATSSWSHLAELCRHLQLNFESCGLWKPSALFLKQLGYQLRYQSVKQVHAELLRGMTQDAKSMYGELHPKRPPPQTIREAARIWRQAEQNSCNARGRQQAYDQYCELLEQQRFAPLEQAALQAANLLERNTLLALVETSRLLQPQVQLLTEQIRRSIGEIGMRASSVIPKAELEPVLALTDRQLALTKEVLECRRSNPTKPTKSLPPPVVRSQPSASPPPRSPR